MLIPDRFVREAAVISDDSQIGFVLAILGGPVRHFLWLTDYRVVAVHKARRAIARVDPLTVDA